MFLLVVELHVILNPVDHMQYLYYHEENAREQYLKVIERSITTQCWWTISTASSWKIIATQNGGRDDYHG